MAFVVQGDTPVVGANSYVSEADFRSYWTDRGMDLTGYSSDQAKYALVKATQYLDLRFEYVGERVDRLQELEWPRQFAYNDRGDFVTNVPTAVKYATCEYAKRALTTALMPDPAVLDDSGLPVKSRTETVGPITDKFEYDLSKPINLPDYPLADRLLIARGLVRGGLTASQAGGLMAGSLERG